ncbi:MAG: polysaccharide deacetylase family protein [Clostridia bacterium]|nr:polysaccharide deacetylase family protein [Clostridia bacterium]
MMKKYLVSYALMMTITVLVSCDSAPVAYESEETAPPPVVTENIEVSVETPTESPHEEAPEETPDEILPVKEIHFEDYVTLSSDTKTFWFERNSTHQPVMIGSRELLEQYPIIYQGDPTDNKVYITMDMGYENGNTTYILDFYKENNIKVLFFLTGDYIDNNEALVIRMIDEGHLISNHTLHHYILSEISLEKVYDEITLLDDKLYEKFGQRSHYVRFPEGKYSMQVLSLVKDMGYIPVFWSNAFDDWVRNDVRPPEYFYQRITENMHNGALMLIHTVNRNEADCFQDVLEYIKDNGYEIGNPAVLFK